MMGFKKGVMPLGVMLVLLMLFTLSSCKETLVGESYDALNDPTSGGSGSSGGGSYSGEAENYLAIIKPHVDGYIFGQTTVNVSCFGRYQNLSYMDLEVIRTSDSSENGGVIVGEGVKIQTSTNLLTMGEQINKVKPSLNDNDLPILLSQGSYTNNGDDEQGTFEYTQNIKFGDSVNLTYLKITDSDVYSGAGFNQPTDMVFSPSDKLFIRYDLDFVNPPASDDNTQGSCSISNELCDFRATQLSFLGMSYSIIHMFYHENNTAPYYYDHDQVQLDLVGGGSMYSLFEGQPWTYEINNKVYEVRLDVIALGPDNQTQAIFTVNNESTRQLYEGESDFVSGILLTIIELQDNPDPERDKAIFILGGKKISLIDNEPQNKSINLEGTLTGADEVLIDDIQVDSLYGDINMEKISDKYYLNSLTLAVVPPDPIVVAEDQSFTLPGLHSFRVDYEGLVKGNTVDFSFTPSGPDQMQMTYPMISGERTFGLLYKEPGSDHFSDYGLNSSRRLITSCHADKFGLGQGVVPIGHDILVSSLSGADIVKIKSLNNQSELTIEEIGGEFVLTQNCSSGCIFSWSNVSLRVFSADSLEQTITLHDAQNISAPCGASVEIYGPEGSILSMENTDFEQGTTRQLWFFLREEIDDSEINTAGWVAISLSANTTNNGSYVISIPEILDANEVIPFSDARILNNPYQGSPNGYGMACFNNIGDSEIYKAMTGGLNVGGTLAGSTGLGTIFTWDKTSPQYSLQIEYPGELSKGQLYVVSNISQAPQQNTTQEIIYSGREFYQENSSYDPALLFEVQLENLTDDSQYEVYCTLHGNDSNLMYEQKEFSVIEGYEYPSIDVQFHLMHGVTTTNALLAFYATTNDSADCYQRIGYECTTGSGGYGAAWQYSYPEPSVLGVYHRFWDLTPVGSNCSYSVKALCSNMYSYGEATYNFETGYDEYEDAEISIATNKNVYHLGEPVYLTDPPNQESFLNPISFASEGSSKDEIAGSTHTSGNANSFMSMLQGTPGSQGKQKHTYIIQFREEPLIKTAEKEQKEFRVASARLKQEKKQVEFLGGSGSGSLNKLTLEVEQKKAYLRQKWASQKNQIISEQERAKSAIENKLGKALKSPENAKQNDAPIKARYTAAINAIAVELTDEEAAKLRGLDDVVRVQKENQYEILLERSLDQIQAPQAWALQDANGTNLTGEGMTIAIIDTGVDYTHPSLGNCTGLETVLTGTTHTYDLSSEHPYAANEDRIWTINMSNFTSIALHFSKIEIEYPYDSLDLLDADGKVLQSLTLDTEDFWTDSVPGGIVKLRLRSDGYGSHWGFQIDRVLNGTTATEWNCDKVIGGYDFYNDDADPMDDYGHGTHCAAIAAGEGILNGVAPSAKIYAYKVLSAWGGGTESAMISAVERAIDPNEDGDLTDHVDVISLSLGTYFGNPQDAFSTAVDNAVQNGVVVVAAAGNAGPGSQTIACPACARFALAVGAVDQNDTIAEFSSRGPNSDGSNKPDIVAPGVSICAAQYDSWLEGQYECSPELDGHIAISGTSMAAPHAAGAAVLVLQNHPDWSPLQVKAALMHTADDLGYDWYDQGAGRLDVFGAVSLQSPPPIIELFTSGVITGTIDITGSIESQNF